jgi:8-oxo-dGTP diphosphatase
MSKFFETRPRDFCGNLKVVTCFMEYEDTILLLQRADGLIAPFKWGIPGGKVEKEESNFVALKRELFEELALKIDDQEEIKLIKSVFVRHPLTDYELILYRWTLAKKPSIILNPKEHIDFIWSPFSSLLQADLLEGQLEAFKLVYDKNYSVVSDCGK